MTGHPAENGFRMPAEWEPHAATWLAWPHNREDWPGKFGPIPWVYCEIVRLLVESEPVHLVVQDHESQREVRRLLKRAGVCLDAVTFHRWKTDRVWFRDTMPSFVVRESTENEPRLAAIDWKFNAWAKYDNHQHDDRLPRRVARKLACPRFKPKAVVEQQIHRLVLEGGAIDVNGQGTILTTEECLLSPVQARNPAITREALEQAFSTYLNASHTIWLNQGIIGDDTHGHVDDIARFVAPNRVVAVVEDDPQDDNHDLLKENLDRLESARDQDGRPLQVTRLPMPRSVVFDGQRLPASYANFYIANSVVLVPTFNDPDDRKAIDILADCFPGRSVVGIHARDLVWGLGTLHCLSREQPAVVE